MKFVKTFMYWVIIAATILATVLGICDSETFHKYWELLVNKFPVISEKCHDLFVQWLLPLGVPEAWYPFIVIFIPCLCILAFTLLVYMFRKLAGAFFHIRRGRYCGETWLLRCYDLKFVFVWVPAGKFQMGLPKKGTDSSKQTAPPHQVKITRGYWVLQAPVTQVQWTKVMNQNPSINKGSDNLPVENVTRKAAERFCSKFTDLVLKNSEYSGMNARLLTEAEWEYASRSGCKYEKEEVISKMAWHSGNSNGKTHPVGTADIPKNRFGLMDTHGNVKEFVLDSYSKLSPKKAKNPLCTQHGNLYVIRGGSFKSSVHECLSGFRDKIQENAHCDDVGFRFAIVVGKD